MPHFNPIIPFLKVLCIVFFLSGSICLAQSNFQLELDFGFAFQQELYINGQEIENAGAVGLRGGFNYAYTFNNNVFAESGVYVKYNRSTKEFESAKITWNNFRLQFPLYIGYQPLQKLRFGIGASIENNKNFEDIDDRLPYNFRFDAISKLTYLYTFNWQFLLYTHWMIGEMPDVYTLESPENGIYLGVIYQFGKGHKR